jgi:ABC-type branched-subunit amino acid transport system ATPase component
LDAKEETGMNILELERVDKWFGGLHVTRGVSLTIGEGEAVFIIGPNGAGKTTLFNLITGFIKPDGGAIRFMGEDVHGLPPYQMAKRGIGRTFQIVKPLLNMTVLENVILGAFAHTNSKKTATEEAMRILELTRLADRKDRLSKELTLAGKKRLEIARALAIRPKLLLLDEVVAGLTPTEADETIQLFRELKQAGISTLGGIEHVMKVVMSISDRVVVINQGEKIAEGNPREVVSNPIVIEAYLGKGAAAHAESAGH